MYKYTNVIINQIADAFCAMVLVEKELDLKFYNGESNDKIAFIKKAIGNEKDELRTMLDDYFESGEAEADLIDSGADYLREVYDILDIEDEMLGNEYDLAKQKLMKLLEL